MENFLEARPLGEESLQMWDLNKRLEAYLARVKFLEEENEGLRSEIHQLRGGPPEGSWRGKYEEEVAALRATLDQAFQEKHAAELARASLHEEVQLVKSRCQKERAAREEAKKLLSSSKKELEEEKRSHIWLRERAAQLEKEIEALAEAHEEERAQLDREVAGFSWSLESVHGTPAPFQLVGVEDYAKRLANIWRGAVETYKTEVSQLEASFGEAKENLWKATEGNRQSQLQLQLLERELAGLKVRKEALEERLAQQWQHQQGEAEKLQLAMEGLEEEKRALAVQIAQVLEDRRQLMHLKMSLSLEVATYRTLLEAESTRLQMPADHKLAIGLRDSKSEAIASKRQGLSLERGSLSSPDPRLSSATFLKGGVTPQPPRKQNGSFTVNMAAVLPKSSRSPVVCGFQKANTILRSQSTKAFEGVDVPAFIDSAAFELGSSPRNEVVTATEAGTVSQSFVRESPPLFSSISPTVSNVLGESSSNAGQSRRPEDGDEISAQMKTEESGKKAELHEEEEEEENQPGEEPPWKTAAHYGPDPSLLVTEALESALQDVPGGDVRFEAGLLNVAKSPNGTPFGESLSLEEENGAAISPSTAALGEATPELHKRRTEDRHSADRPEDINGSEYCSEAHSGPEAGLWVSRVVEPSSPQETESLEEERSPPTQRNKEDFVFGIPVAEDVDCCNIRSTSEQTEGGNEQLPDPQTLVQREESEEGSTCTESASQRDTNAAAPFSGDQDRSEPGPSCPEDQASTIGTDVEEAYGGAEDLEVVSTEALHLSEDEERRALSSPSRESEEGDFQAEMLDSEFLQTEDFAVETLSPVSRSFYSAEGHQEHHFLGVEQETPEEQAPFPALQEEEGKEVDLEPETSSIEEAVLRDEHTTNISSAEPRATEEAGTKEEHIWEPQQDIMGHEGLLEEEDALGKEDTMEKEEMATLQDVTCEQETVLQKENVESVPRKETSKGEQGEEAEKGSQGDLPVDQWMEEEEVTTKGEQGEETVEACQGDLPVEQQEERTMKGGQEEETVEAYQGDLPAEQQEEEVTMKGGQGEKTVEAYRDLPAERQDEEVTTKGEQGEETVEACQGDLPVEQQEEEVTTKGGQGEETVEAYQGDLPAEQQDEEVTTKGEQGEETVEACQGDLPVEQQEEEVTTKGGQGEETVQAYQGDLPVEQQEEEITTKGGQGEETVEAYQGDLPAEQQDEEVTTKGEQGEETVEACQGDLPAEQQGEEVTTKGGLEEETVEACQRDLPADQQEEEVTMASPESDMMKREVLITGSEAAETEEMEAAAAGSVSTSDLQEKENPEVQQAFMTESPQEEEQTFTAEREEAYRNQCSPLHETSIGALEVPSGVPSNATNGFEAESYSGPGDLDMSSESDHHLQSDYSGSEVSLESLEVSPNAACETEGIEKEFESSKRIKLEETLPDNTPLHLYDEKMLAVTGKDLLLPENKEASGTSLLTKDSTRSVEVTEQELEEACLYGSQTEGDDAKVLEDVEKEGESAPKQVPPNSEELPVSKDLEEAKTETLDLVRNNEEDLHSGEPVTPITEAYFPPLDAEFDEQPKETLKRGSGARKEAACGEMTHEETCSTDFVWEIERDNIFQADQPDSSYDQEQVWGGNDSPLECSDPNNVVSEGSHKVSPLTSVADLGEIVLEEEQTPDGQEDPAEPEGQVYYEDESLLGAHESQPISDLESCGREDPTQETDLAEIDSSGMDFTEPSPKAEASLPIDGLKASDILEIVEQALEFNQEVIKASEQTVEVEQLVAWGDPHVPPEAESNGSSLALPDVGRSQVFTETLNAPSPNAKDPTGSDHWVENIGNGLPQDSSLPHFTTEILNGIGDLHSGNRVYDVGSSREELIEEVAISQHFDREDADDLSMLETLNQNPPRTNEEASKTGEICSEIHKDISLEHRGQEGLDVDKSLFANILQSAHVKGKEAEIETVSIPPHFGEDILHLESSQHLTFRPEGEEELWSPEDN
uniref:nestin n=1 Tax=Euleptes europaea TaxID=460621 RepID=UPI00253F94AE|nr:nestin [Euleptes europaea]